MQVLIWYEHVGPVCISEKSQTELLKEFQVFFKMLTTELQNGSI